MKIAFRVDASIEIGTGHVMRCLALADALASDGAECHFICRAHPGHLLEAIQRAGHRAHLLPGDCLDASNSAYRWLGVPQEKDAVDCVQVLSELQAALLVVDHYCIDAAWEQAVRAAVPRIVVIDDLADRAHCSDLLVDQVFGRRVEEYQELVPSHCRVVTGAQYCLLRPEFAAWREYSLGRRQRSTSLRNILVTMGGIDLHNATGDLMAALNRSVALPDLRITVVMGKASPWLESVRAQALLMRYPIEVLTNVSNMAELMAHADAVIGAGGTTSWERCCLGVPSLLVSLAPNQDAVVSELKRCSAALSLDLAELRLTDSTELTAKMMALRDRLTSMSEAAALVTDGLGTLRVADLIKAEIGKQVLR